MQLKTLTKKQHSQLQSELCRRSFFEFVKIFWSVVIPEDPVYNWHIEYLCGELQQIAEKLQKREVKDHDLIINIPPGTSKSTIATVMLPAWLWTIDPRSRVMTASYSASLSTDHSVKSRDIIKSELYKALFPDLEIKHDQDNKTHYKNNKGGERYATSVTGSVMGFHAHLLVIDDPLNSKKASSEVEREAANQFMNVVIPTRKVHKEVSVTVIVMQRLHQDDPTGNWITKGHNFKHICLPGEYSDDIQPAHLKEFYVDGMLDPIRLNKNALKELETSLGSYGYAGQIQQIPAPKGGGIWKQWLMPIDRADIPDLSYEGTDFDTAYTEKETNSASAYITAGEANNRMYITAAGFEWVEFPDLIKLMKRVQSPVYIEGKASGKSAKQVLVGQGIPAIEVKVEGGDKIARAQMVTSYAEAGMIYCDKRLIDLIYNDSKQGILTFPNNSNDDLQDALVQSINRLLVRQAAFSF